MMEHAFASKQAETEKSRDFTAVARRVVEEAIGERLDGSPLPEQER